MSCPGRQFIASLLTAEMAKTATPLHSFTNAGQAEKMTICVRDSTGRKRTYKLGVCETDLPDAPDECGTAVCCKGQTAEAVTPPACQ